MAFAGGWPAEHPIIAQIRESLFTATVPESCAEMAARTGLARPLIDAVFWAELGQGDMPTPCPRCDGTGAKGGSPCTACRGGGIASAA